MAKPDITAERLREILDYDPQTGVFAWKIKPRPSSRAGDIAGHLSKFTGYLSIGYARKVYYAHRLAWLYVYGSFPRGVIDHINGDRRDNRIANLRDVDQTVNGQNQRKARADTTSGFLGVFWNNQVSKWQAKIKVGRKNIHLGTFDNPEMAHAAYIQAKRKLHEGCTI